MPDRSASETVAPPARVAPAPTEVRRATAPRTGSPWRPKALLMAADALAVVTFTTDVANDRSECLVLDARNIADGPVARLRLPERISSGTHAAWAPGSALPA